MASRWAYEALMVKQFKDNSYEKHFYEYDKQSSIAEFKQGRYAPKLEDFNLDAKKCWEKMDEDPDSDIDSLKAAEESALALLREEISAEMRRVEEVEFDNLEDLTVEKYNEDIYDAVDSYIKDLKAYYAKRLASSEAAKDAFVENINSQKPGWVNNRKNRYHNEKLQEIVKNSFDKNKIIRYKNRLIQQLDPIFLDADNSGFFGFRAHFYAPRKWFCGRYYDTFSFNIVILWLFCIIFYVTLYFDLLRKLVDWAGNLSFKTVTDKITSKFIKKDSEKIDDKKSETVEKKTKIEDKTEQKPQEIVEEKKED